MKGSCKCRQPKGTRGRYSRLLGMENTHTLGETPNGGKIPHMISPIITFADECSPRCRNSAGKMKKQPITFTEFFGGVGWGRKPIGTRRENGTFLRHRSASASCICVTVNTQKPFVELVSLCIFHAPLKTSEAGKLQYGMSAETLLLFFWVQCTPTLLCLQSCAWHTWCSQHTMLNVFNHL